MSNNKNDKTEYDFSHDKKEYITRATLTKMLNEIKTHLFQEQECEGGFGEGVMFDDFGGDTHLFPAFANDKLENVVPIVDFIAKRIQTLNKSFRTSTDSDERLEIIQGMLVCSASLSLLTLATYHDSQQLINTAKDIYRGIER